ncbi:FAD-dependent oxidoreductase [Mycolicibacterium sp. GCM10028919]|uniref:FAD-dependent oxidoreductase n=1 Tax=Mycolicibacterium sp. GCM10028919 TaxID=3273401 RepID=UPI0036137003
MTIDADLVVIGFGKGGKTLAATLGKQGKRVVMIERSAAMYGGTCINIGCVPTKSMVYQAEEVSVHPPEPAVYTAAVRATADLTTGMRGENFAMLDTIPSVDVLTGAASFVDPHTVAVDTADGTVTVTGRTIVIGTGSEPTWPDLPGLRDNPRAVTSTDLLSTEDLPARLVVLGGGYVGLEFAAMYAAYGAEVTVLERHDAVLSREDDDIVSCATELLGEAGVRVVTSAQVTAVDVGTVHYEVGGAPTTADADLILVALGRHPVTADLGLANAGVVTRPDGSIEVDEHLRTNVPHVFAVGDVNGGPQFTYVSLDDYRIVADQLTGSGSRSTADRRAVPFSLFMTPPLSRVGMTEREARAAGHRVKVAALPVAKMATVPRARIVHQAKGMMKAVVDADTDEILGAALLSYDSHEVINTVALAMRHGITASTLRDEIYTHPSMTEAFNQLLGALV